MARVLSCFPTLLVLAAILFPAAASAVVVPDDYPTIQATALVIAVTVVLANIIVDLTYAVIDPRIRYS